MKDQYHVTLTTCNSCGNQVGLKQIYFCSMCWWKIPAQHRAQLMNMHLQKRAVGSKIHQCVRLIASP